MNYIYLLLTTFLGAFALGYAKFFGIAHLSTAIYAPDDKLWIIQIVGSLMTIGPVFIYFIAAPLASAMKKKYLMALMSFMVFIILGFGFLTSWVGTIWFYLFATGLLMGAFSMAKMASVPLEAIRAKKSTDSVNAGVSITFVIGLLSGMVLGAKLYEMDIHIGTIIGIFIFAITIIPALFIEFPEEKLDSFVDSANNILSDSLSVFFKYSLYLISGPLFWGIAGAVSLAAVAYAEQRMLGSFSECSFLNVFAAVGIIIGSSMSPKFGDKRFFSAFVTGITMVLIIIGFPVLVETGLNKFALSTTCIYWGIAVLLFIFGIAFGCCVNLIDSELLHRAAKENREGITAAMQSACVALSSFIVGGLIGGAIYFELIGSVTQFAVLAVIGIIGLAFILILASVEGALNNFYANLLGIGYRFILRLRYDVKINGTEHLKSDKGVLVLPNHPAEIDPVIIGAFFWKKCKLHPVVTETFYFKPIINNIFRIIGAFAMPDMDTGAGYFKTLRINRELENITQALNEGENILLYPAGRLIRDGREKLGASSGTAQIIENSDAKVLFARTRGLNGSMFSTALTNGITPDLGNVVKVALKMIIKNFIFFIPKREIIIDISLPPAEFAETKDILEQNQIMENYFNGDIEEQEEIKLVSLSAFKKEFPVIESSETVVDDVQLDDIDNKFIEKAKEDLSEHFNMDIAEIIPSKRLSEDLGLDSLSKAELLQFLDDEYAVTDVELADLKTVADVIFMASGANKKSDSPREIITPKEWFSDTMRPNTYVPEGETIIEAFLNSCDKMGDNIAVGDDIAGVITWKKFKIATLLLAKIFREYEDNNIGIMLPASVGAAMSAFGVLLAGKTPVMINWTTGRKNLEHMAKVSDMNTIITSGNFLDKLVNADFGNLDEKFVFLEDLKRDKMGLGDKISAAILARKSAPKLIKRLKLTEIKKDNPAVILFTSGSESMPKGVPLTHENILANLASVYDVMKFDSKDIIYGFLPPFHSFGFTVTTMLPFCTGIKVAYYPNPTEGRKIAIGCEKWKTTMMCGTPSFFNGILKAGKEHLSTVKTFVAGAEKTPDSLLKEITEMGDDVKLLEGYGITECSPVLTINYPNEKPAGVGRAVKDVTLLIVDPETNEALPQGERGLILANGKNIFNGYLKIDNNPFIELNGEKWYKTGDLGYLTETGHLILAGRMKRFVKIGGEMISLPAIETTIAQKYPPSEDGPTIAIHADEKPGERPELVLFTSIEINIKEINAYLKESGFSNLSKIGKVIKLDAIPLLGTGKTDYQTLKKLDS